MKKFIRDYLIVFILFYAGYTFINWLLTTKTGVVEIDKLFSNLIIPLFLAYLPTYFILNPAIKRIIFNPKVQEIVIWTLLPFSISIPTALAQPYFKDISYKVVTIESPAAVLSYPRERFFKIRHFYVVPDQFTVLKKQRSTGRRGKKLKLNHYYIGPLYDDSARSKPNVAYGIRFSTTINRRFLAGNAPDEDVASFTKDVAASFHNADLYKVSFFEKQMYSQEAKDFAVAWRNNRWLNQMAEPIVLMKKDETYEELISRRRKVAIFSLLISLSIVFLFMLLAGLKRR